MQFEKVKGNISSENDYVNMRTKAGDAEEAIGKNSGDEITIIPDHLTMSSDKDQKALTKKVAKGE